MIRNFLPVVHLSRRTFVAKAKAVAKDVESKHKQNFSFMANIFRGNLECSQVFPFPEVLTNEQRELVVSMVGPIEKFFQEDNNAQRNDERCQIDEQTLKKLWELGGFGLQVAPEHGGLGLNNTQYSRLCEIIGANDLGLGITLGAHQSIGFKGVMLYGTAAQKEKYLPQVSSGGVYAAFALTEPSSGSDAASIRCRAEKSADGKHYILNGSKIWISNGGIADIFTVFAQTPVIDPKTNEKKDKVTAFIVERGFTGVTSGPPENKMGIKASNTAELHFEDVKIPIENVLGEEGEGFKVAMNILNNGRFGMGATLSGTMKYCIQKATEHANNRLQFGKKIKEFETIQEKLARMNMYQYATESMAYTIAQNMDMGSKDYHLEAAISKVFASEAAWFVCDEAIQVLGGMGFMKEADLERVMRDLRIFRIFEGTNDILRLLVALTGIQHAGSELRELQEALKNPLSNLGFIFSEVYQRAAGTVGLKKTNLSPHVVDDLQPYASKTSACIDHFANSIQRLLFKYGKGIINEQFILNRVADSAIDIYAMVVTQSRASRAVRLNLPTAEHELNLTKAWCLEASNRCEHNLTLITGDDNMKLYEKMRAISKKVCDNNGALSTNVVDN